MTLLNPVFNEALDLLEKDILSKIHQSDSILDKINLSDKLNVLYVMKQQGPNGGFFRQDKKPSKVNPKIDISYDLGGLNKCVYCDSEIPGIDDRKDWPEQRSEVGVCLPCWSEMDNPPALPDSPGFKEEKSQIIKKVAKKKSAKKKTSSKKSNPKLPETTREACDHLEYREI